MSKISVLKSNGQWSEPVYGLDKVHLVKCAIQYEYSKTNYWYERVCGERYPSNIELKELEINTKKITTDFMDECPVIENNSVDWFYFKKYSGIDLPKAKLLKMRLSTLEEMRNKAVLLSSMYDKLITSADIPSPTPEEYCLTFKFEEE